ncbi:MarR family winged helix-turn-helix transcriptional regulator [Leifsonia sp. NPDC058194]|uniref:MarR family winged helix-turn-helix transcriptional regulator n=1 Tax=Leifsonia sp. NPDC058194 TaxID=3346374 RepID=UPI0036D7EE75
MTTTDDRPAPAADLDAVLRAANVLLGVAARSVLEVEDTVTSTQLRALVLIATTGARTPGELATELGVHPSNATRTCERLVRAGLVDRSEDPGDRRSVRLVLSADGSALVERVLGQRRAALAEVLASIPASDRPAVTAAFDAFARTAEAHGSAPVTDARFTLVLPADPSAP